MDIFAIRNILESSTIKINVALINLKWKVGMKRLNFGTTIYVHVYFLISYLYINKPLHKTELPKSFVDPVSL